MRKILATAATHNYLPVIAPYLETISAHSNFDVNLIVALDCQVTPPANVKVARLSNSKVKIRHGNNCLQHGEFMRAEGFEVFSDDDVICFTDGDVLMQRAFDPEEASLLESLSDNEVMVQFNAGQDDNLHEEYYRLQPGSSHHRLESLLGADFRHLRCYNTGVLVCNKKTWGEIFRLYDEYFPLASKCAAFGHYASQQWILSLILGRHLKVRLMDPSFHMHFHYGRVPGSRFIRHTHFHADKKVLFSHYAMREGLPISKEGFMRHQAGYLRDNLPKFGWRRHLRFFGYRP